MYVTVLVMNYNTALISYLTTKSPSSMRKRERERSQNLSSYKVVRFAIYNKHWQAA